MRDASRGYSLPGQPGEIACVGPQSTISIRKIDEAQTTAVEQKTSQRTRIDRKCCDATSAFSRNPRPLSRPQYFPRPKRVTSFTRWVGSVDWPEGLGQHLRRLAPSPAKILKTMVWMPKLRAGERPGLVRTRTSGRSRERTAHRLESRTQETELAQAICRNRQKQRGRMPSGGWLGKNVAAPQIPPRQKHKKPDAHRRVPASCIGHYCSVARERARLFRAIAGGKRPGSRFAATGAFRSG